MYILDTDHNTHPTNTIVSYLDMQYKLVPLYSNHV